MAREHTSGDTGMGEPGDDGAELIHMLKLAGTAAAAAALTAAAVIVGGQSLAPSLFAPVDAPQTAMVRLAGG